MKTWRVGILGFGAMGRRFADGLRAHPNFLVGPIYDPGLRSDEASRGFVGSAHEVVDDSSVDCVYIASPPRHHREQLLLAVQAGKAVFCEKPLAVAVSDAAAMREAADRSRLPVGVNFPFATSTAANQLRRIVQRGELGVIEQAKVTLRFSTWPRQWQAGAASWLAGSSEGGFTREVLSHFVFLAIRTFGPAKLTRCEVRRGSDGVEKSLKAQLSFSGCSLDVDAEVSGDIEDFNRFEVRGSSGTVALTDWYSLEYNGVLTPRASPLGSQLEGLAKLLNGDHDHGLATLDEAQQVVEIIEGMLNSSALVE